MNTVTSTVRQSTAAAALAAMMSLGLLGSLGLLAASYHDDAAMAHGTMAQAASAVAAQRVVLTAPRRSQS